MPPETPENANPVAGVADKCPNGLSCLEPERCGDHQMCRVKRSMGDDILLLDGELKFGCPYLLPFGYGHLCTCPVHARLYKARGRKKEGKLYDKL